MSDELWQAMQGVWPPLAVVVPLLLLGRRPWSTARTAPGRAQGVSLGIGLGFAAAYWTLKGSPLPPGDATEWLVVLVALAGVLGAIAIRPQALWTGVALLLLAASPLLMLSRLWNGWDGAEAFAQLGLSSAVLVATGAGLAPLGARARGAALPLALSMVSATGGYVLFAGQSASLGQLSGALAAGFGACAAFSLWQPGASIGRGGTLVFALGLGGLVLLGHHLAWETPPALPRLLLLASAFCAWVERSRPVRDRSNLVRACIVAGCTAVPLAIVAWLVHGEFEQGY